VIVADNRRDGGSAPGDRAGVRLVGAAGLRSPHFARNQGARAAAGEWLIFLDADTTPEPDLLEAYLSEPPEADVGLLAGGIEDVAERETASARYVRARAKMDQRTTLAHARAPYAQTANCAVRRTAFEAVDGFSNPIRAGEDADLCWRLQAAGWRLETRPAARVAHRPRESLPALLAQMARHGSGAAWLDRRYPGAFPPPGPRAVLGRFPHFGRAAIRALRAGDREGAVFAALDLATLCAYDLGRLLPNDARR
jgi:mycofactocin glycosyltransferase